MSDLSFVKPKKINIIIKPIKRSIWEVKEEEERSNMFLGYKVNNTTTIISTKGRHAVKYTDLLENNVNLQHEFYLFALFSFILL